MATKILKRTVDAEQPGDRDRFIFDNEVKGFGLKVTPAGRKVYILQYRMGGRGSPTKRYTIGVHGVDKTPEQARDDAIRLRGQIRDGVDPATEKREARAAALPGNQPTTIDELIKEYIERWARPKKRSADADERMLRRELLGKDLKGENTRGIEPGKTWRGRAIKEITRRDIVVLLDGIVDRGSPITANRALAVVRRMFNFAIERDLIDASPCVKVRAPADENQRERNLSDDEIRTLWPALDRSAMEPNIRRALRFMLVTAQRKGEVIGLHEREINRDDATWTIPASRAKNGREHVVSLSPLALEIIDEAIADFIADEEEGEAAGWVFPSSRTGEPYRERSISHAVQDLFKARPRKSPEKGAPAAASSTSAPLHGVAAFVAHDLRRTAATKMRELGIAKSDVSLVLNHVDRSVTGRHYDCYEGLREKRHALDAWARKLESLIRPAPANVVELQRAG